MKMCIRREWRGFDYRQISSERNRLHEKGTIGHHGLCMHKLQFIGYTANGI